MKSMSRALQFVLLQREIHYTDRIAYASQRRLKKLTHKASERPQPWDSSGSRAMTGTLRMAQNSRAIRKR